MSRITDWRSRSSRVSLTQPYRIGESFSHCLRFSKLGIYHIVGSSCSAKVSGRTAHLRMPDDLQSFWDTLGLLAVEVSDWYSSFHQPEYWITVHPTLHIDHSSHCSDFVDLRLHLPQKVQVAQHQLTSQTFLQLLRVLYRNPFYRLKPGPSVDMTAW